MTPAEEQDPLKTSGSGPLPPAGETAPEQLSPEIFQHFRWSFPLLFLLLAAVNFDSLTTPPFWDDLIGVQTQAVFLARNHLSISALLNAPRLGEGHAACYYLPSVLSWFYALLYLFLSPAAVHCIGHLLSCAFLAAAGGLFLELTRRKLAPELAVCGVLFALTHPLLAARAAGMDQEAFLAFFVMLTLFLWNRHRKRAAAVCGLCSLTVKLTGAILIFAIFAKRLLALLRFMNRKRLLQLSGLGLAVAAIFVLYFLNFGTERSLIVWKPVEIRNLLKNAYYLLLPEFLLALGLLLFRKRSCARPLHPRLFFAVIGIFYGANFLCGQYSLPRYGAIIVLPTAFVVLAALQAFSPRKTMALLGALSVLNIFCCFGFPLPEIPKLDRHNGSLLERSLEFASLRRDYRNICAELEKNPPEMPLVVPWPMLQMLTVPEFGYVKAPIPNIVAGEFPHPLGNFKRLDRGMLEKGVLVLFEPNPNSWKIPANARIVYASEPEDPLSGFLIYRYTLPEKPSVPSPASR